MLKNKGLLVVFSVCFLFFACKSEGDKAFEEAGKLVDSERYTDAIEFLDKAIEKSPNHAGLFYWRGYCYNHEGDPNKALNDFTNCIRIDNKYANGYYGIAGVYKDKGEYDLAEANYNKAIEFAKNNERKSTYLTGLASLYNTKKDYSKAIEYMSQAIKLEDNSGYYYSLGLYLYHNDQMKEAEEAWLLGIKKDSFRQIEFKHYTYRELAAYYYRENELEKAKVNIEKALELSPNNDQYLRLYNLIKEKIGK